MVILLLFLASALGANIMRFSTSPSSISVGSTMSTVTVTVVDSATLVVQSVTSQSITLVLDSGSLGGTTRVTSTGTFSFTALKPYSAGTHYLIALSSNYDPISSSSFVVSEQSSPYSVTVTGSASIVVSTSTTYTATLYNSYDQVYTNSESITMNLYGTDSTAVLGGTTTTTSSTSGVASFPITIDRAGTFYLYPTISGTTLMEKAVVITVAAAASPTAIVLTNPGSIGIGKTFSVTATLTSGTSNVVSVATSVTLSVNQGSLGGYSATLTTAGVVTFSNIYLTSASPAGSYTLTAASATYSLTTSVSFIASITSVLYFTMASEPYFLKSAGTYTYTLKLATLPLASVTVTIASSNTGIITVSPSTVTFTTVNYNTAQTVTLTVISGGVSASQTDISITHVLTSTDTTYTSASAGYYGCDRVSTSGTLTVTVLNTVNPGTLILSGTFYVVEGSSSTFNMYLSAAPSANVVVSPSCPSVVTCTPASLTFTSGNYNSPQTITVAASAGAIGNSASLTDTITYTFTTTDSLYTNGITSETSYVVISSSSASAGITQSKYPVINEKGSTTYTISMKTTPSSAVTITLTTSSADVTVSPTSLSFTTTTSQTVTITHNPTSYPTSMMRYYTITHTTSSSDANYDGTTKYSIEQDLPVYIMNPCTYGQNFDSSTYTCVSCPVDYSCDSPITATICSSGEYSTSGVATCLPCPPGYQCNPSSTGQVACTSGYYSLGGTSSCTQCAAGTACVNAASPPSDCPLGTYSAAGATSCTQHTGASVGFPSASPTTCTAGYIPAALRTHCEACIPGHYCSDPTTRTVTPCATGYYSAAAASSCTQCPVGHACSRTEDSGQCPEGYYSLVGQSSCVECQAGYYCTGGVRATCTGSYKVGMSDCTNESCPAAYYCTVGLPPMPCPPGYISALGDGVCTVCTSGTYEDANTCVTCPAGHFCPTPVSPPIPCFFGTYSVAGSTSCTACSSGYTCGQGSTSATQISCPPGFDCSTTYAPMTGVSVMWPKPCAAGTYGTGGSFGCSNCVAGYFCPGATADYQKFPCPPGHYCPAAATGPTNCAAGKYNPNWSSTASTDCLVCSAGYYSNKGAPYCLVCPPGGYCASQSSGMTACSSGTYYFGVRGTTSAVCQPCPKGYYCDNTSNGNIIPQACPPNTYRTSTGGTTSSSCTSCENGLYCALPGISFTDHKFPCIPGYYCTSGASPATCAAGTYSDSTSLSANSGCTTCPDGWVCSAGTSNLRNPMTACPPGSYCTAGVTTACPAGYYSNKNYLIAASECSACPAGSYCASGSTYPIICPQGKYCAETVGSGTNCLAGTYSPYQGVTNANDCLDCPPGNACAAGSQIPTRCTAGNYYGSYGGSGCTTCPAGYYCPTDGWITPRPCNKGYYSSSGATSCTICPAGHYCPVEATTNTAESSNICPAGLYCPAGTDHYPTNLLDRCSKGYWCAAGTTTETACLAGTLRRIPGASVISDCISVEAGYYVSTTGASAPTGLCSAGYYCTGGSTTSTQFACAAGTYRLITGGTAATDCGTCPAGMYCSSGSSTATVCPAGKYCPSGTGATPTDCPAGTYNPGLGMYRLSDCIACPAGYYCSSTGLTGVSGQCVAGYYCAGSATTNHGRTAASAVDVVCPTGGYCPLGTPRAIPCPIGYYMPSTGNSDITNCVSCTAGYYCAGAGSSPTGSCDAGYYCTGGASSSKQFIAGTGKYTSAGATTTTNCAIGTYNPSQGQSVCLTCPSGFYCPSTGMTVPTICPAGSYCGTGASSVTNCPVGTYNPFTGRKYISNCINCPSGYACPIAGLTTVSTVCSAGWWCYTKATAATGSTVTDNSGPCPVGFYCIAGSPAPRPCPPGTYNPSTQSTSSAACISCTQGYYCEGFGNSAVTGSCLAGYYCPTGTSVSNPIATICTAGHYCVTGVYVETQCSAGYYQANKGQSSCIQCPAGFYCPAGTTDFSVLICPTGHYCLVGTTSSTQYPCATGTYNPITGAQSSSYCVACDPGSYCATTGLSAVTGDCNGGYYCTGSSTTATPTGTNGNQCTAGYYCPSGGNVPIACPAGRYCATAGLSTYTGTCTAGYYCISLAITSTPNGSTGYPCSAGYYCPAGAIAQIPCPSGTYNPSAQQSASSACLTCTQGYYCQGTGLSATTGQCTAGFYCPAGSVTNKPNGCTAGNWCPTGSYQETACTAGNYQPNKIQSTCLQCPAGFYCAGSAATTPVLCPAGYYCPLGTSTSTQYPCSAGTYNPSTGRISSSACLSCPPGEYCSTSGLSASQGACSAGYYCTSGSSSSTQNICTSGYYCPAGSSIKIKCPAGKYCNTSGLSAYVGDCTAGYYCTLAATTPTPTSSANGGGICSAGYYCPTGSFIETPCPIGTYNANTQSTSSAACISCTAGYYCNILGATTVSGSCKAGFYCVIGSVTDTPDNGICDQGYYCPTRSASQTACSAGTYAPVQGLAACLSCPVGFTCEGGTSSPVQCAIGYYCTGGNSLTTATPCAAGSYNPFTGQFVCLECPYGFTCQLGATGPTVCPAGSYCSQGLNSQLCQDGTYSEILGLQRLDNCKPCQLGGYCNSGVLTGDCTAGYYCVSGNTSPTPLGLYTDSVVGSDCPSGYYCTEGTVLLVACPYGKFTTSTGASEESQCTDCIAGYYCIPGDPIPYDCPIGSYCPSASQSPTSCPIYTYSNTNLATSSDTCIVCPSGYLCDSTSIGDLARFPCTYGHYCLAESASVSATVKTPCPKGTWGPTHALAQESDCYTCPAGSYCDTIGIATITHCDDWQWCNTGSTEQSVCPGGYYCHENTKVLEPCPGGYYCQETYAGAVAPPIRCDKGYYCPPGSASPTPCPDGTVPVEYSLRISLSSSCVACPAGTYSLGDVCLDCDAGFVCVSGASRPDPLDLTTDGGYSCPSGYYCPVGSGEGEPCPVGTYYSLTGAKAITDCIPCAANTFGDLEGQSGCYPCGPNAYSQTGSTTCLCYGFSRAYMKRDGTCRCIPGYSFYKAGSIPSDEDSSENCIPTVLLICATGYIRAQDGTCVLENDCTQECDGGDGKRNPDLGVCVCINTPSMADVCDTSCQANTPTVTLGSDGKMVVDDPNEYTTSTVDFQSTAGYTGKIHCFSGYNCEVKPITLSASGAFTSNYQPTAITGSRRRLTTDKVVQNPVICMEFGDTMIFTIPSETQYPVYYKDSLLNSNPDFDYGPFLELESLIVNGKQNITSFGYTFVDPGTYVFANKDNKNNYIIVTVMEKSSVCPVPYLRERYSGTVSRAGVSQSSDINVISNWETFIFLVCVFILFVIVVTVVNVLKRRNLKNAMKKNLEAYRKMLTRHASLVKMENDGKLGVYGNEGGADGANGINSINPQIFEEIYRKLQGISDLLKDRASLQKNLEGEYVITVSKSLKEMKDVIHEMLFPQTIESKPIQFDFGPENKFGSLAYNPSSEPETQKLIDKIAKDPGMNDKAKQELLDELQNNFASLEAQLAEDQIQAANTLKHRINQRNKARRELLLKKQKLEEQEKGLREEMQNEIRDVDRDVQQFDKDFEKDVRRAREKEFGNTAKTMRKDLLERIRKNPDMKEQLEAQYEAEMVGLERTLDQEKGRQHNDLMRRLEERKNEKKRQAQLRAEKAMNEHMKVSDELDLVTKQIDLAVALEAQTQVALVLPKQIDLSEGDERNIDRKFKELQKNSEIQHDSKQSQLEKQKQKLTGSLSEATTANARNAILEEMRRVEEALQEAMSSREANQKKILADRLKERRRLRKERQEKGGEIAPEFEAKTVNLAEDQRLHQLQEIVGRMPENEKLAVIKQLLSDKHDQELIELQSKQQKRAGLLHANVLREALDNKTEATRLAPEYLSAMDELQQKQAISGILLEGDKEVQIEFQNQWKDHQRRCNDELLKLLDVQMKEVGETLKKIGIDSALSPEAQEFDSEFRGRQSEMEREAQERLWALERQRDDLSRIAREKQEELEKQIMEQRRQDEVNRAKKALEEKQRKELEEKARKGEMTKQQMEELIAQHQKDLALLEDNMGAEKKRQMALLKKKLDEKQAKKIKKLDVPEDLKNMHLETAQLLKGFRGMRHGQAEFDEDILAELLRRVSHVEQVIANIDQRQFAQVLSGLNALKKDLKKL